MRILDGYLIRQFLHTLVFAMAAFLSVFIVVDVVEHVDTYIDREASIASVLRYYLFFIPYIVVLTLPVAMLLSSLFSVGLLAKHRELTAMKTAGLSLYRILWPIFSLAFLISLIILVLGELIVPLTNQRKAEVKRVEIEKRSPTTQAELKNLYFQGQEGRLYYFRRYDGARQMGSDVVIQQYRDGRLISRIDAEKMYWRGGVWVLKDGFSRQFTDDEEIATAFREVTAVDLREKPQDLSRRQKDPEEMGYFELRRYIDRVKRGGGRVQRELVDLYLKFSFPFANLIIVMFGAPIASNPRRSGMAVGVAVSLFICFSYWGVLRAGQALGYNGSVHPVMAAWLGNIIFGTVGVLFLTRVHK